MALVNPVVQSTVQSVVQRVDDVRFLGLARRFGGASAAYSLRDIGGGSKVVRVRRNSDGTEQDFSASQVQNNAVEDFCKTPLTVGTAVNGTGSFTNYTFTANGNTGFDADNSSGGTGSAGFPYTFKSGDVMTVTYTVSNFDDETDLSPAIRGTTGTASVTDVAGGGTTFTANGTYTDTLTATADGTHLMFADGNTGAYTISNFAVTEHKTDGFVAVWYDQSGNSRDAAQATPASQPFIVKVGVQVTLQNKPSMDFDGRGSSSARGLVTFYDVSSDGSLTEYSVYAVFDAGLTSSNGAIISSGHTVSGSTAYGGFHIFSNGGNRLEVRHQTNGASPVTTVRPINTNGTADGYKIMKVNYNSSSLLTGLVNITSGPNAESTSPALPKARTTSYAAAKLLKIGSSFTFNYKDSWQGLLSEVIMFEDDIRSDNNSIASDLTSFYGQPSSTP